ncbi:PIN domain-containing protein [Devosia sp. A449]
MIGIDSNVLVRMLVDDDVIQVAKARAFLQQNHDAHSILINVAVLMEAIWLLRSRFRFPADELLAVVRDLLDAREFEVDRREIVEQAWEAATASGGSFPDCLIACMNLANGCSATVTFDHDAADLIPGMELLA